MAEDDVAVDVGNTTVRVAVRVRPMSDKEFREGGEECVEVASDGQTISLMTDGQPSHSFAFDHVFGKSSTQPQVFEALGQPLLDKAFEGYNATIFAYGQTGSGKTHTMMSDRKSDDRGLIPRISENLFDRIAKLSSDNRKFLVCCSFLEIYNEIVYDLLVPRGKNVPKAGLEIREGKGIGVYVKDLQEIVVDSSEKLQKLIDQGFEHRAVAATQMNATSSRSHCLFIIKMHQKDDSNAANNNFSKMNLVDLAGSERASRTGAQGDTLKEGANINKSLSALGNVINALSTMAGGSKKVFIPYRNSKLTRVLQESLGGNALTTMMAACSPSRTNFDETLSTLNYAKRAKTIKVNATKNEEAEQIAKLQEEVEALRQKLTEQMSGVADTSRYQTQIEEMERFMKQTWEDKERESLKHEEERKALEREAQKSIEKAMAERTRRLRLLEEKGDLELSVRDLLMHDGAGAWAPAVAGWSAQISKLISLEQKVATQCRAATLCKDAMVADLTHWFEQCQPQGAGEAKPRDGDVAGRMLLQQAERKAASMLRELESLERQERDLEVEVGLLLPQVQRVAAGLLFDVQRDKEGDKQGEDGKEVKEETTGDTEEYREVLSLVGRQLDAHRAKAWGRIAEDHKGINTFVEGLRSLMTYCAQLGGDGLQLSQDIELELEVGGSSGSRSRPRSSKAKDGKSKGEAGEGAKGKEKEGKAKDEERRPSLFGDLPLIGSEAAAARARPLGLASEEIPDAALTASSNAEAAPGARLLGGVVVSAHPWGGWCPSKDQPTEYLQVDLGRLCWVSGISIQGRQPASGAWEQTRPLLTKLLDPEEPLPPERVFKRPPVRLIHDVVVVVHTKHKALPVSEPNFKAEQLDYKLFQSSDRQAKVDFFELLFAKIGAALQEAGWQNEVSPLAVTASDILGGKNTVESSRMLQLLIFIGLRSKLQEAKLGGLVAACNQWVTKFGLHYSPDGTKWQPLLERAVASEATDGKMKEFVGNSNAHQLSYCAFGPARPLQPLRFLRLLPLEWHCHPGLRMEVHGWPESEAADEAADSAGNRPSLSDKQCRLDVLRRRAELLRRAVGVASASVAERLRKAHKAEEERNQQALVEKSQVEQQLQDALKQLEELRHSFAELQDKAAESEQRLIDGDADRLRLEVERDRADQQSKDLEAKLSHALDELMEEKGKSKELTSCIADLKANVEDLSMQIGVLTEERDVARAREEELFDTLNAKEEELMNTNEGYVYLTDQLNEVREDMEEKLDQRDRDIELLTQRNDELMNDGLEIRKENGELRRRIAEAEKAVQRAGSGLPMMYRLSTTSEMAAPADLTGYPDAGTQNTPRVEETSAPASAPGKTKGLKSSPKSGKAKSPGASGHMSGSEYEDDWDEDQ